MKKNSCVRAIYIPIFLVAMGILSACKPPRTLDLPVITDMEIPLETAANSPIIETTAPPVDPEALSPFTGEEIGKEAANKRPFLLSIDNLKRALPQSGIAEADMYIEMLAEGGITRILALFQDFKGEKIGPIRSARDYFGHIAVEYGAILIHHGASPSGYAFIKHEKLAAIDGMRYDGSVFLRDKTRTGARKVHSSFTAAERLEEKAEALKFSMVLEKKPNFLFYDRWTKPLDALASNFVEIEFSKEMIARFEYEEEPLDGAKKGRYKRFEFDAPQIDETLETDLLVSNIIIQEVGIEHIPGDDAGRRKVDILGSGNAYLLTGGSYKKIYWEKTSLETPTKWLDENSENIYLNTGKTWVCLVSKDTPITFEEPISIGS